MLLDASEVYYVSLATIVLWVGTGTLIYWKLPPDTLDKARTGLSQRENVND